MCSSLIETDELALAESDLVPIEVEQILARGIVERGYDLKHRGR